MEPTEISDIKNYKTDSRSLSSGQVLKEPYSTEKARIIVSEMTENLVLDMVRKGFISSSFTLMINYDRENVDNDTYHGEVQTDYYGRVVPVPSHGTANFGKLTSSTSVIKDHMLKLYDRIVTPGVSVRRITISANDLKEEQSSYIQYDIFTDVEKEEQERKLQKAMIEIQDRFGKNAMLKGTDLLDGATTIERNSQIGGHRS